MTRYEQAVNRGSVRHGDRWDASSLDEVDPAIRDAFNTGARVKVTRTADSGQEYTRTGTVGMTTGWRPAFLLMHRSSDIGSSDVIGPRDRVVARKIGREYRERIGA